ncbi:MAG: hypothetical protein EOP20_06230 [Hyphomicrobiales bacterium]|nr:MAG: hypothetical protein EOP20_06230 [Hyphomicrobiales bacterium]
MFTGELSIPRGAAEAQAAASGCPCGTSVSGKTGILVVGEQDLSLAGQDGLSGKQRKAAALNAAGAGNRILDGDEFVAMLRQYE